MVVKLGNFTYSIKKQIVLACVYFFYKMYFLQWNHRIGVVGGQKFSKCLLFNWKTKQNNEISECLYIQVLNLWTWLIAFVYNWFDNEIFFCYQEIEHLEYLEETTLSSDLSQGFALKSLTGNGIFWHHLSSHL